MRNVNKVLCGLVFFSSLVLTAQNPDRRFHEVKRAGQVVEVKTSDGKYEFQFYTPEIVETSFIPAGEVRDPESHAVVLSPQPVDITVSENASQITLDSEGIDVRIKKEPFQVFYSYQGDRLTSEKAGYYKEDQLDKISFNLKESEVLYGGGARALGMDRRGHKLELYNRAHYGYGSQSSLLNYTLPVVLSSQKYAIHFDNAPIGALDLDSQNDQTLTYETISGRKTYQIITGNTWENLVGNYTLLTGRQPMPPRWALGNFASRFGYHSQEEVMRTIKRYREEDIPVDALVLDLFWFGHEVKGTMGNLEFVKDSFPEPQKMISDLKEDGVQTILITEPFIVTSSNKWEEAVSEKVLAVDSEGDPYTFDFFFGHTGLIDIFDPKAREWFWEIYEGLSRSGVAGWWGDLGEPEVHPEGLLHKTGSSNEVHNIYGHYWAKLIYDGYSKDFPKQRPFILMRAGAAGSQRFGLIPWSGDVSRTWGGLLSQPEIALQMGLQGLGYMHSDLGGFAGDIENDDLYVRWLQYGVFQPVFRPHAQEAVPSEPVFRKKHAKDLAREAIKLRYRLLPYNYTLSFVNTVEGTPLMRPLFFEEPDNFSLYLVANQYLWGHDFLVSPVLKPAVTEKELYFPGSSNWFDFYSGKKFEGGSTAIVPVVEQHIPTFVRGGAFIPMSKPLESTQHYSADDLEVHFFFDPDVQESSGMVYHDDGITSKAYENGDFELMTFQNKRKQGHWEIIIDRRTGKDREEATFEEIDLVIHNFPSHQGNITVDKTEVTAINKEGKLVLPVSLKGDRTSIIIKY